MTKFTFKIQFPKLDFEGKSLLESEEMINKTLEQARSEFMSQVQEFLQTNDLTLNDMESIIVSGMSTIMRELNVMLPPKTGVTPTKPEKLSGRKSHKKLPEKRGDAIVYTNCDGDEYFLHEGVTKTGKPRYFVSKKNEGTLAKAMPGGFEFYEQPGGRVYFRKIQKTPIREEELHYVQNKIADMIDQEYEDEMAQYKSPLSVQIGLESQRRTGKRVSRFEAEIRKNEIIIYRVRYSNAMPIMKFALENEEKRLFHTSRWCFMGSIDDWIGVGTTGYLFDLVDKYCPTLGTEDFYELMYK